VYKLKESYNVNKKTDLLDKYKSAPKNNANTLITGVSSAQGKGGLNYDEYD
jgi:hypothetical protein